MGAEAEYTETHAALVTLPELQRSFRRVATSITVIVACPVHASDAIHGPPAFSQSVVMPNFVRTLLAP